MLKVVYDCTPALFPHNGIGRVTGTLFEKLKSQSQLDLTAYARSVRKKVKFGAQNFRLPLPKYLEKCVQKLGLIDFCTKGADLYHATDHFMPVKHAERTVVTVHDLIFLKQPEAHLRKIHHEMIEKVPVFLQKCRHIITCSTYTKNDLVETLNIDSDKITVIPWGMNHNLFKPEQSSENITAQLAQQGIPQNYFLGVSCSEGRKNTPMLLDCYKKLLSAGPVNDLVLVWDAPQHIREKYNHPKIHFTGRIDDETLRNLYTQAEAVVYPSTYEGFGLPVLEAMSCGVPIICSDVTSLPEVGGAAAIYINPFEPESLENALLKFENQCFDRQQLITKGLQQVKQFNWENCAQNTVKVYQECA